MSGPLQNHPSPIALFTFNRPKATARALAALASNHGASESSLTIFCDGPNNEGDEEKTDQVREIAQQVTGFKSVRVVRQSENLGSAQSIRLGLGQMFDEHEAVVVLEDDLITSQYFLKFMNSALAYYATDDRVVSICGYSPSHLTTATETYFLPGAHCWGWGAWSRSWTGAELNARKVLDDILQRDLVFKFDLDGAERCTQLLHRVAKGEFDSWVLPWMGSAIVNNQLTLYPAQSLVRNDGLRASKLSARLLRRFESSLASRCPEIGTAPLAIDASIVKKLRSSVIRLHCRDSRARLLFNLLMALLPETIRRPIYVARVLRSLQRSGD